MLKMPVVMGYLPRRAANRVGSSPGERSVAVNMTERHWSSEECFDIRHVDAEFS